MESFMIEAILAGIKYGLIGWGVSIFACMIWGNLSIEYVWIGVGGAVVLMAILLLRDYAWEGEYELGISYKAITTVVVMAFLQAVFHIGKILTARYDKRTHAH